MMKTVGAATAGSIAFAGSASASADEEHLEELSNRATPGKPDEDDEDNGKGPDGLRDETPAAVGAKAPQAVKRDVRAHERNSVTTNATKSDSESRSLDGTSCDDLEVSTTMNGSFSSFWSYGGLQAKWESDGHSQANATGCGYWDSDKPDEFTISVTTTVNGIEMSISIAGFGGGTTNGTNSASYTGTFQNEDDASHDYDNFVVKSPVALYNAKQEASTTAVFDTDAYSVSTRVSKA